MLEIVRMGLERRDQIAAIWTSAFADDPFMGWLFPDDATRRASLTRWWEFTLDHLSAGSELHGTRADGCVAYWQPPRSEAEKANEGDDDPEAGKANEGDDHAEESGAHGEFMAMMNELLGDLVPSRLEGLGQIHQARLAEPHWYLAVLGTSSDQQSRGLGSKVLAPMLDRCDRAGMLAYLESSNPANVGFYRRHRFETTGELMLGDDVLVTLMAREPRPPED